MYPNVRNGALIIFHQRLPLRHIIVALEQNMYEDIINLENVASFCRWFHNKRQPLFASGVIIFLTYPIAYLHVTVMHWEWKIFMEQCHLPSCPLR